MRVLKSLPVKAMANKESSRDIGMRNLKNKKAMIVKRSDRIVTLLADKVTMNEQLQYSKELYQLSVRLVEVQDSIDNYDKHTWFRSFDEFAVSNRDPVDLL